jgi:hypothetical protein
MRKTFLFFGALLLLLVGGAFTLQIVAAGMGSSVGGTLQSGRSVTATSDSWYLTCNNSPDTATIKTAGRTIVVAPDRVSVDGKLVAPLDEAACSVEVHVKQGKIEFVADGTPVGTVTR